MLHHDPLFIDAELAYRREGAVRRPSYWELERTHPVRETVSRWWHALTAARHEAPAPQPLAEAPAPQPLRDAEPETSESLSASTEARALEHAQA